MRVKGSESVNGPRIQMGMGSQTMGIFSHDHQRTKLNTYSAVILHIFLG